VIAARLLRLFGWEGGVALAIALAISALSLAWPESGPLARLETEMLDLRFRLRPVAFLDAPITIIVIDDKSIAELGRWPWSRQLFAALLDRFATAPPKLVAFDLLFTEPQPAPLGELAAHLTPLLDALPSSLAAGVAERLADPDRRLAEAIQRFGDVILPFAIDLGGGGGAAEAPPGLRRAAYAIVRGNPESLPPAAGLRMPVPPLADAAMLAHVTSVPDAAGTFRWDYPVLAYGGVFLPSLAIVAAARYRDLPREAVTAELGRSLHLGDVTVPTDEATRLLVNYYPPGSFTRISFADVLRGRIPEAAWRGKIVLIGAAATGLGDVLPTPFVPAMPGVERHATLIANLLRGDFLRRDGTVVLADLVATLLGTLAAGLAARRGVWMLVAFLAAFLAGLAAAGLLAFDRYGIWLGLAAPALSAILASGLILFGKYLGERRSTGRIRAAFSRYLHPDLVEELCRAGSLPQLGGEERTLTVLFADLEGFTGVAEGMTPPALVALVNEFFTAMGEVVMAHRGMVDKFIGDCLMAVFGAPFAQPAHARLACEAALAMRECLGRLQERWRAAGLPPIEMRIGINSGDVVIGNMGTAQRLDYTVMGDAVNVAARLEAANRELGTRILISGATLRAAGPAFDTTSRGHLRVKGRGEPVEAYELLGRGVVGDLSKVS